ncbi:hypothetical protein llap_20975 [Limosa lapponica baueri]|uniref:Uncharacterized protein n=1 Tax=Limosa lapponica baueri TaxID=1758121 RepID=A0A2I0T4J9_LIMLA|nr:hypothetical protein llap_20975 [Limosa lapponica baueri]
MAFNLSLSLDMVAQIYQSIEFSRLVSLVPFVDAFQLERNIVDAARHCDLQQEKEEQHQLAVTAFLKNSRKEHQRILARRQTIEERKERLESLNIQREKEELEQREAELQKVRKAEEERLRQEAKEREKERILQEHEQIKKKTVRERLEQIKKTELGAKAFKDIDIEIDYFERAKRLEEIPLIKTAYEEQRVHDMELWEQQEEERITTLQLEREKALEHKNRLSRMLEDRDLFEARLKASRRTVYEVREIRYCNKVVP